MSNYENHITISVPQSIEKLQLFCFENELKCLIIDLQNGEHTCQPMTSSYYSGSKEGALKKATEIAGNLEKAGFIVVRMKIEQDLNDSNIYRLLNNNYYETHCKIKINSQSELNRLIEIGPQINCKISKNSQKINSLDRFLTQRIYEGNSFDAKNEFAFTREKILDKDFVISKYIEELVCFDSKFTLDKGW